MGSADKVSNVVPAVGPVLVAGLVAQHCPKQLPVRKSQRTKSLVFSGQ